MCNRNEQRERERESERERERVCCHCIWIMKTTTMMMMINLNMLCFSLFFESQVLSNALETYVSESRLLSYFTKILHRNKFRKLIRISHFGQCHLSSSAIKQPIYCFCGEVLCVFLISTLSHLPCFIYFWFSLLQNLPPQTTPPWPPSKFLKRITLFHLYSRILLWSWY